VINLGVREDLGVSFLDRLYAGLKRIAARYRTELRNEGCECLPMPGSESVHHLFPVLVLDGRKQKFLAYMRSKEIVCGEHYPILIPDQHAMEQTQWEIATPLEPWRHDLRLTSSFTELWPWLLILALLLWPLDIALRRVGPGGLARMKGWLSRRMRRATPAPQRGEEGT